MLDREHGLEKTNKLFAELMEYNAHLQIKIEPGIYYMYIDKNYEIDEPFSHEKHDVYNMNGIDFFLSRDKLDLSYFDTRQNSLKM